MHVCKLIAAQGAAVIGHVRPECLELLDSIQIPRTLELWKSLLRCHRLQTSLAAPPGVRRCCVRMHSCVRIVRLVALCTDWLCTAALRFPWPPCCSIGLEKTCTLMAGWCVPYARKHTRVPAECTPAKPCRRVGASSRQTPRPLLGLGDGLVQPPTPNPSSASSDSADQGAPEDLPHVGNFALLDGREHLVEFE